MSHDDQASCVIRPAGPGDLSVIIEFNRLLALETESKDLDPGVLKAGVERALADPDRLCYWVAEIGRPSVVVAQAAVSREWSDWRNGWLWWFQSVYVAKEQRGRGLFRALYRQIRAVAFADPEVIGLRLYVEAANDRAQAVYQSLGMTPGGYLVFQDLWLNRPRPPGA